MAMTLNRLMGQAQYDPYNDRLIGLSNARDQLMDQQYLMEKQKYLQMCSGVPMPPEPDLRLLLEDDF